MTIKTKNPEVPAKTVVSLGKVEQEIRALTFSEFSLLPGLSPRLTHGILSAIEEDKFPYTTIGDYLDAGSEADHRILKIRNIGRKTQLELKATIESLLGPLSHDVNNSTAHPPNESVENTRAITFSDLAQRAGISPRLAHSITHPQFPFKTIGEYLDAGARRNASVNMVPHTGHKTIVELVFNCINSHI